MISVIVPVYNVEQYLPQCLDSLLAQTLTGLEIILVDDGSTDSSGKICDAYSEGRPHISVIHKKNGGLMSAWKTGVLQAKGEYVGFVDSDDWVESDMFAAMGEKAAETGADMVLCGLIREEETGSKPEKIYPAAGCYDRQKLRDEIFPKLINFGPMMERYISPNRVTKLFRRSLLLENLNYCDDRISLGEDLVTTFSCILDAQSFFVMDGYYPYHYRIHGSSIMGAYHPDFFEQAVLLNRQLHKIAETKQRFDFSVQLNSDFVGLVFSGMEHNLMSAPKKGREIRKSMKKVFSGDCFRQAVANQIVTQSNTKCKIYGLFLRLHWYTGFYWFVRDVVCKKRKYFGY